MSAVIRSVHAPLSIAVRIAIVVAVLVSTLLVAPRRARLGESGLWSEIGFGLAAAVVLYVAVTLAAATVRRVNAAYSATSRRIGQILRAIGGP